MKAKEREVAMNNKQREVVNIVKERVKNFLEYTYRNTDIEFTDEMKREIEGKNLPINYATLYEAYLNTSDRAKEDEYKLYQIEKYIEEELVYTKTGLLFFKNTKEGSAIKDIIDGKREYKVKRK